MGSAAILAIFRLAFIPEDRDSRSLKACPEVPAEGMTGRRRFPIKLTNYRTPTFLVINPLKLLSS